MRPDYGLDNYLLERQAERKRINSHPINPELVLLAASFEIKFAGPNVPTVFHGTYTCGTGGPGPYEAGIIDYLERDTFKEAGYPSDK